MLKSFIFDVKNEVHYRHRSLSSVVYALSNSSPLPKFKSIARKLSSKFGQNVSRETLMVRMSRAGPQIVLVDPLVERI